MKRRTRIQGIGLILLGCLVWLYLGYRLFDANIGGVFYNLVTDSPINSFESFRCPRMMYPGESAPLDVEILNTSGEPRSYRPELDARYFQVELERPISEISVPDGGTIQLRYTITPIRSGTLYLQLTAYADKNPSMGSFGDYSRSFRQSCGVLVMHPLTASTVILSGLICVLAGGRMIFARSTSETSPGEPGG